MSRSPRDADPSGQYETAWSAITKLIHGESSWSGRERNIAYLNNGDGTFCDVSGATGLDFIDDSRAYAAADFDGDGDTDLVLKSRNEPGLRVLRNDFTSPDSPAANNAIAIGARGSTSNRDAIGARITVVSPGARVTKTVAAGSGFLSQHSKEVVFGLGRAEQVSEVRIEWPSGTEDVLTEVPVNFRFEVVEGSGLVSAEKLLTASQRRFAPPASQDRDSPSDPGGVWLLETVRAPAWKLMGTEGVLRSSNEFLGSPLLLNVWATWCPPCRTELRGLQDHRRDLEQAGLEVVAVSVDDPDRSAAVAQFAGEEGLTFPLLVADSDFATAYNLLKRNLLNRRTDLRIPTSFLVNSDGYVEKIYEGVIEAEQVLADTALLGEAYEPRLARVTPFAGLWVGPQPRRNHAELGAALLERGLVEVAVPYFESSAAVTPHAPDGHYNLGTAYLRLGRLEEARASFERALRWAPGYPEAHNSLGVVLTRLGRRGEAISHFRAAIAARVGYAKAIGNLATAYERAGKPEEALKVLEAGIDASPSDPALRNRLGTLHARHSNLSAADRLFQEALRLDPAGAEAVINLALLDAQRGKTPAAVSRLDELLKQQPDADRARFALAQIYVSVGDGEKARVAIAQLLARNPEHREARRILERLGGGN